MALPTRALRRPLLLLALLLQIATAIHVTIPSSSSECFSVEAEQFKHGISLNYEVLHGVAEWFRAELTDGKGKQIFEQAGPSGRYVAPIGDGSGTHTVCFKNEVRAVGDVVVGFSFHADDPSHEVLSNADATKIKQVQELEDLVYELSVHLDTVKDTQSYMKVIKQHHLQVLESTHSRIVWWSCLEAAVLLALSIWQLAFLRRTLEVRRLL
uniref:GOLD domain-containing protein n=1 Tax=Globisporangium ultimum (strain ATCC 200006 / CBS 805.95 / DAOM BR144) TaxID=431595 RepID=K3XC84_GLOUD